MNGIPESWAEAWPQLSRAQQLVSCAGSLSPDLVGLPLMPRQCVSGVIHRGDETSEDIRGRGHVRCKRVYFDMLLWALKER